MLRNCTKMAMTSRKRENVTWPNVSLAEQPMMWGYHYVSSIYNSSAAGLFLSRWTAQWHRGKQDQELAVCACLCLWLGQIGRPVITSRNLSDWWEQISIFKIKITKLLEVLSTYGFHIWLLYARTWINFYSIETSLINFKVDLENLACLAWKWKEVSIIYSKLFYLSGDQNSTGTASFPAITSMLKILHNNKKISIAFGLVIIIFFGTRI